MNFREGILIDDWYIEPDAFNVGKIWIEKKGGEGGEFDQKEFEKVIKKFFDENF